MSECGCVNCIDNRFYDGASTAPYTPKPCLRSAEGVSGPEQQGKYCQLPDGHEGHCSPDAFDEGMNEGYRAGYAAGLSDGQRRTCTHRVGVPYCGASGCYGFGKAHYEKGWRFIDGEFRAVSGPEHDEAQLRASVLDEARAYYAGATNPTPDPWAALDAYAAFIRRGRT